MSEDTVVYMFNALWFKPDGGAEKYSEYMRATVPLTKKYGFSVVPAPLIPGKAIIGDFDADMVFFVKYDSMDVFNQLINDPEYQKIRHLREEAITKSLLIPCKSMW